jgi:hypothetical protein
MVLIKRKKKKKRIFIVKKKTVETPTVQPTNLYPKCLRLKQFQKQIKAADSYPARYRLLSQYFENIWHCILPNRPLDLIENKIAYYLLKTDYIEESFPIPEKIKQKIKASEKYEIGDDSILKCVMKFNLKKEKEMAKESKKKKPVAYLYLEIFDKQLSKKLSDEEIAKVVEKETGIAPTMKNVASYRCMYNAGKVQGQKTAPAARVPAFNKKKPYDKTPIKKPAVKKEKKKVITKKKKVVVKSKKTKKAKKK